MLAYTTLAGAGKLGKNDVSAVHAFVCKTFATETPDSNNQHYQRGAGLALAAKTFPAAKQAKEWQTYAEQVFKLVTAAGDITEDAPNYNRIDMSFLWLLAESLNKTRELTSPSFRAMFARFAAQVAPSGLIPSYGDSGGPNSLAAKANFSVNPWAMQWGGFVAGFLRAACEFHEPSFSAAAAHMLAGGTSTQPLGGHYNDVGEAFRLLFGVAWGRAAPQPAAAERRSAVLTRRAGLACVVHFVPKIQ